VKYILSGLIIMLTVTAGWAGEALPFEFSGYLTALSGTLPPPWTVYRNSGAVPGWTDQYQFEQSAGVLHLTGTADNPTCIQTKFYPFPDGGGEITFDVYCRSVNAKAKFRLFLLGDDYAWNVNKELTAKPEWAKYTVSGKFPAQYKQNRFWLRIDADKNSDILIGKIEILYTK